MNESSEKKKNHRPGLYREPPEQPMCQRKRKTKGEGGAGPEKSSLSRKILFCKRDSNGNRGRRKRPKFKKNLPLHSWSRWPEQPPEIREDPKKDFSKDTNPGEVNHIGHFLEGAACTLYTGAGFKEDMRKKLRKKTKESRRESQPKEKMRKTIGMEKNVTIKKRVYVKKTTAVEAGYHGGGGGTRGGGSK